MSIHSCLVQSAPAALQQDQDKYWEHRANLWNKGLHLKRSRTPFSPSNLLTISKGIRPLTSTMSGYYGQGGQPAYPDDNARRLLSSSQSGYSGSTGTSSGYPAMQNNPYTTSSYPSSSSHQMQVASQPYASSSPYASWSASSYPQLDAMDYTQTSYPTNMSSLSPSGPYAQDPFSNAPWSGAPDESRSPSPHPSDLHNYGIPLPDGQSWRCKYPGCNSEARFTRGCDLRKHYKRHTKSLFCRRDDCQHQGGFSSNKDRVSCLCFSCPFWESPLSLHCFQ